MHRIHDLAPPEIYTEGYWNREGFSTIPEQVYNVSEFKNEAGLTKNDMILKHCSKGSHALELACAPGALLKSLRAHYDHVVGVEVDTRNRADILKIADGHAAVVFGLFPEVSKHWPSESYDFITALDLFEHVDDPEVFMKEVLRLLKPDGTVVLMSPFLSVDRELPEQHFCPEHIQLMSESYMKEWFSELFQKVELDEWLPGHNVIAGKNKLKTKKESKE